MHGLGMPSPLMAMPTDWRQVLASSSERAVTSGCSEERERGKRER
jgi:hypothetical protein